MAELAQAGATEQVSIKVCLDLERRAFLSLLRMTNAQTTPQEIAWQLVLLAQQISGCEAVAIRLKEGPDFPYAASIGFPNRFLALENSLCLLDEEGHLRRDEHRLPILACLCGCVLAGRTDQALPCFTEHGSFFTGSTSRLLSAAAQAQRLGDLRGRCHTSGYETVALFPIRRDRVTYGLIHCNDPRPDCIDADQKDLLEELADTAAHLFQQVMA
jgi:GAF domain-containing protein